MKPLGKIWIFVLVLLSGCGKPAPSGTPTADAAKVAPSNRTAPSAQPQIGINLTGVVDWSSEVPFVDVFKTSRPWMETGPGPFTYDDRGNPLLRPGQAVEALIFRGLAGHYPAGLYVATYEGTGEVDISLWDPIEVTKKERGRIEFRVNPGDEGILVRVLASSPRDPIRNLRVWLPGFENAPSRFHPTYLERLKPFSVIRFMDWQRTNNSHVVAWSQRTKVDDLRWTNDTGVPVETMCSLANALHVNPWFCVPHAADDDYIRNLAALIKDKLDPKLKIYIEYSNEVWNWGFQQAAYAAERGKKLQLGAPDHLRYYSRRSVEVFTIFSEVFGGNDRLIRVLCGQFASPSDCDAVLKYQDAYRHADAFAVGAYFGYEYGEQKNLAATLKLTLEKLLDQLAQEIDGKNRDLMRRHAKLAQRYGLQLLAYEGGQHLVGHGGTENSDQLTALFIAANRHPRMAELYRKQLQNWVSEGGSSFMAFAFGGLPGKFGSWGVLEYQDQPIGQAPRYRALCEFSSSLKEARK